MGVCQLTVKRTRLCYCKPVTPVECVSLSFRTHPCFLGFITHNWDDFCLVNSIYLHFALHIFQIRNLLHCVDESWWNMPYTETWLGDGVADDVVAMLLPLWLHAAALWCHAIWKIIVTSHNAWLGYEYPLQNFDRPRAIHKHNPHPLETIGRVWYNSLSPDRCQAIMLIYSEVYP